MLTVYSIHTYVRTGPRSVHPSPDSSIRRTPLQGPWHRRGNSRFSFLARLHDTIAGGEAAAAVAAAGEMAEMPAGLDGGRQSPLGTAAAETGARAEAERLRSQQRVGVRGQVGGGRAPIGYGSWRAEMKANACHVPSVMLAKVEDHT